MSFIDKAKDVADDVAGKAKDVAGDVGEKAGEYTEKAKVAISDLAHSHGHKVTGAVDQAGAYVDDKTGGKTAPVSSKASELTEKAVEAAKTRPAQPGPAAPDAPTPDA